MHDFLTYLQYELYRSDHTVEAYRRDLQQFIDFHTSQTHLPFEAAPVTTADIRRWIAALASEGTGAASLRRKTQSLRAYFKFLCRRKELKCNPAADITLAKLPKPLPDFVRDPDMEALLDSIDPSAGIEAARDHLILHLLYATGLRRSELLQLTDASINPGLGSLRVVGKGRKERVVPLATELLDEIARFQTMRDDRWPHLQPPRPLIATSHGAMSAANIEVIIKRLLKNENAGRKSPHTLRHTFATSMLNGGAELNSVRAILGHSSLATTQIYTHLQTTDLRRIYSSAHPRGLTNPDSESD